MIALPGLTTAPAAVAGEPDALLFTAFGLVSADFASLPRPLIDGGELVIRFSPPMR